MEEKKEFKLRLLPNSSVGHHIRVFGQSYQEGFCRFVVTLFVVLFSQFLSFIIPLVI